MVRQQRQNARNQWARKHLEKYGFCPGEELGAGYHGTVFRYRPSQVIKLTDCWGEAFFFSWLLDTGWHPGFPQVERVKRVGSRKGSAAFAVIREDLPDLIIPEPDLDRFHHAAESLFLGGRDTLGRSVDELWSGSVSTARWILSRSDRLPTLQPLFDDLMVSVRWAIDKGCRLSLLHQGNLGIRENKVVVRDLSGATPPVDWLKGRKIS